MRQLLCGFLFFALASPYRVHIYQSFVSVLWRTTILSMASTVKEITEYNLNQLPKSTHVTVDIDSFMYIYRTLEEFMRFFHNKKHYTTMNDVTSFLGTASSGGAFEVLNKAIYNYLYNIDLPDEIESMISNGTFDAPTKPNYYFNNINKTKQAEH